MAKKSKPKQEKSYIESITDKIGEIAVHYGFSIVKPPQISSDDIHKSKQFKDFDYYDDSHEKTALTRWYIDERLDTEAQPLAIHYKKQLINSNKKKHGTEIYGFEIMGSARSTSEALLIKCALAVLNECGYSDVVIDVNSIGDKESITRFERELSNHFKKNAHIIPSKTKQEYKKNHYLILTDLKDDCKEFQKNIPQTIGSLSENSRLHFKEILEYIETFDVAYKIKPNILSNKLYASNTVFEIRQMPTKENSESCSEGELLAYGYRYNHLAKKLGAKREIPSVGLTIFIKKTPDISKKILVKNIKKPKFYLVQLGPFAKLKALQVVEALRKQKIPVYHSITKDKITGQLSGAEYMKTTHVLIMGQKEAIENTVIVRNVVNREQETVLISELGNFLKNLNKDKKK